MKTKGKYFWKTQWYSICSKHQQHDKDCDLCDVGRWHNIWKNKVSSFFHDNFYFFWLWINNTRITNYGRLNFTRYKDNIREERLKKLKKLRKKRKTK